MRANVSLLRRFSAIAYDIFLVFSLVFFIGGIAVLTAYDDQSPQNSTLFYWVTLPTIYLYFALSWVRGGQTLGMKAWKFRVIQKNGQAITHRQSFIRFVGGFISWLFFGMGFFYQWLNTDKLTFHDKISDTHLVKT